MLELQMLSVVAQDVDFMKIEDFETYSYKPASNEAASKCIGWLGAGDKYETGEVDGAALLRLELLSELKANRTRGLKACPVCGELFEKNRFGTMLGSSEIKVVAFDQAYTSPSLIVHFIRDHNYCPPEEFLIALKAMKDPLSEDGRTALMAFGARFEWPDSWPEPGWE